MKEIIGLCKKQCPFTLVYKIFLYLILGVRKGIYVLLFIYLFVKNINNSLFLCTLYYLFEEKTVIEKF